MRLVLSMLIKLVREFANASAATYRSLPEGANAGSQRDNELSRVFINNPMITITIRISSPGLIFNPTIIDYRSDHAAITDYD